MSRGALLAREKKVCSVRRVMGSRVALFFFALLLPAAASAVEERYRLRENGEDRSYVVARDEIHSRRSPKRILPTRSAAEAAAAAEREPGGGLVLYPQDEPRSEENRRYATRRVLLLPAPGADVAAIAARVRARVLGGPRAGGHSILEVEGGPSAALDAVRRLRGRDVLSAEPLLARQRVKRAVPNDPFLAQQWHLDRGTFANIDANVFAAWDSAPGAGLTGQGVTLSIVDDGLQRGHADLRGNYDAAASFDFNDGDPDPTPRRYSFEDHGTACAGLAAGVGNNGIGIAGVAYRARLGGIRLIAAPVTDQDEADAFAFRTDLIAIKSNSWGPPDSGRRLEGPGKLASAAIAEAVETGRAGRGSIFVFSAGNGRERGDNSNFDGYSNLRETIAIAAATDEGLPAPYSEPGANLIVAAPSNGGSLGVFTTDLSGDDGYNFDGLFGEPPDLDYTSSFGGTSAACPIVAGIAALMLEANPALGWRDVQEILIRSARRLNLFDPGWQLNAAGFFFHHDYGAGLVDAAAAVALARTWENLGPNMKAEQTLAGLRAAIPDGGEQGVEFIIHAAARDFRVEHVQLTTNIAHQRRGQLEITLTSPSGMVARLAEPRPRDKGAHYRWTFLSTQHWGEQARGDWKVRVADRTRGTTGSVLGLTLTLWGAAADTALAGAGIERASDGEPLESLPGPGLYSVDFLIENRGASTLPEVSAQLIPRPLVFGEVSSGPAASLAPGEIARMRATFSTSAPLGSVLQIPLKLTASGGYETLVVFELPIGRIETFVFESDVPAEIPSTRAAKQKGKASVYPLAIDTGALPPGAVVVDARLRLKGLSHLRSADLDFLLESPSGRTMIPMSDVGGFDAPGIDLELRDDAAAPLPATAALTSGTWRPADYDSRLDLFPRQRARTPHGRSLSVFRGEPAAGIWNLYAVDDRAGAGGTLQGWALEIVCALPN
jgi:subtilisin family serine protease